MTKWDDEKELDLSQHHEESNWEGIRTKEHLTDSCINSSSTIDEREMRKVNSHNLIRPDVAAGRGSILRMFAIYNAASPANAVTGC